MKSLKGPGIFLAQFMDNHAPFDSLENICQWASALGYKGIQIPTWEKRLINLELAAESTAYCHELQAKAKAYGLEITELSTHLQGQLIAVHPTYDQQFDAFAPVEVATNPTARQAWATQQLKYAAKASRNLGLTAHVTFSGSLLWPFMYPWPQRPEGIVELGFGELAKRWLPILNDFHDHGVAVCYELHPNEDLHDGVSFEAFLEATRQHPAACINYDPSHLLLQQMDYAGFIDVYHERIKAFHVKDAEFNPSARQGVYGGFQGWINRAGRFRSLGDGQVDFKKIFSALAQHNYDGWAVLEWECCIKSAQQGAAEGAPFIQRHMIDVAQKSFDDFAGQASDDVTNRKLLGLT